MVVAINTKSEEVKDTEGGRPAAVDVFDMISPFDDGGCKTAEIQDYIDRIKKTLSDKSRSLPITVKSLDNKDDAIVFTANNKSIVLAFNGASQTVHQVLNNVYIKDVNNRFNKEFGGNELLNVVLVNRAMVGKVNNMIRYIDHMITAANMNAIGQTDITALGKDSPYALDINVNTSDMRAFMDEFSPMATSVRDYGFICSIIDTRNTIDQEPLRRRLFGVSAYTEWIFDEANSTHDHQVFTPRIHITEIITTMYTPNVLALILPIAADVLIGDGLWQRQYSSTGDNVVNLGHLFGLDAEGKLQQTVSDQQIDAIIASHTSKTDPNNPNSIIAAPLVVDIPVGGTNIPGLTNLIDSTTDLADHFIDFLGIKDSLGNKKFTIASPVSNEVSAIVDTENKITGDNITDLRQFSYLYMTGTLPYDQKYDQFLLGRIDPVARYKAYEFLHPSVITNHIIHAEIDGGVAEDIAMLVNEKVNVKGPFSNKPAVLTFTNRNTYGASTFGANRMGSHTINVPRF